MRSNPLIGFRMGLISRLCLVLLLFAGFGAGYSISAQAQPKAVGSEVRASAAYAEVLLKRTELQSELEGLTAEYTDDFPKVTEGRYAVEMLEKERVRLLAVKPADVAKLTLALGKLMVRKVELEVDLWTLRKSLQEAHPDVRRAKRKLEIFEAAIKEILG
jgi:hypothetical protein